jgi:hypothetical protein
VTNIGSTDAGDLANFELYDSGIQVGDTVEDAASDKSVTFDLSDSPLEIEKGVTKTMHVKADIINGTNRTFQFSLQNMTDIVVYDTQYGIYIKPNQSDSWSTLSHTATTINTGKMTVSRASDSPSGNVAADGTNVIVAKYDVEATGENVKIASLNIATYGTNMAVAANDGLYQGKVYFDGVQKGSTTNLASAATDVAAARTSFSFGNTFIVPADGDTHTLTIRADIKDADGDSFDGNETITIKVRDVSATGRDSLQSVSVGTATGYQLSVSSGSLTTAKSTALSNYSSSVPTGVPGKNEALVGLFTVTAGSGEGADITAVKLTDSSSLFGDVQNLKVYNGTKESGTQIGNTQSSVSAGSTYTFNPSPYITLNKSQQIALYVYADLLTGAGTGNQGAIVLSEVDGVGADTSSSVNDTTDRTGQTVHIASAANLTVHPATSTTPVSEQILAGTEDVEFTRVKFTAGAGEDIDVTEIVVTATLASSAPTSSVTDISLWDGSTQLGSDIGALVEAGTATFNLSATPWRIAAGDTDELIIKADINSYSQIQSGGTVRMDLAANAVNSQGAVSGSATTTSNAVTGNAMTTYKTRLTFAENSSTPSGSQTAPKSTQHVLYFDVTNQGDYAGELNAATFTISYTVGTGNTTTSAARAFNLYESSDTANSLGSVNVAANTAIDTATFAISLTNPYEIAAGATKTFYLIGDVRDCGVSSGSNVGSKIQFYINAGTDMNWDDKVSTTVQSTMSDTFPVEGGVLEY